MKLSRYVKIYPYPDKPGYLLLYATRRGASILVKEAVLEAIEDGSLAVADRDTLLRLGFLAPDPAQEKEEMLTVLQEADRHRQTFSAVVILNLDCNLACTYCYEGTLKGQRYMAAETADRLVAFLERHHLARGKDLNVHFHGGEPLLGTKLIESVASRLRSAADALGRRFGFTLITNGTLLTRKTVEVLRPLGLCGAKVTIDGPREVHDRFRPFRSGKGSFDLILDNVGNVCDLIPIQIGGNYTRENYRDFPPLLDTLVEQGLTPDKIALVKFDPVNKVVDDRLPPDFNQGCISLSEPWLIDASLYLRDEILRRGFATPKMEPHACMIGSAEELVINYDGSFYKCPAFVGMEGFAVGDLKSGVQEFRESHCLDSWKQDECLECAYLPICFGGCRLFRLLKTGAIDGVDCKKAYYDAALEGLLLQDIRHRMKSAGGR